MGHGSADTGFEDDEKLMHLFFSFREVSLGPRAVRSTRSAARLSSATTSGSTMSKSSVPGPQLHATWGSVILLPAPEPGCRPQGRAAGGRPGWLEGVMQPQGSRCGSRLPLAARVEAP